MTLYEMTEQAKALYDMLSSGEIDEQTFNDTLESIGVDDKINSYCSIINQFEGDKTLIKAEIERLKARSDLCDKNIARMKIALDCFMQAKESKKEQTAMFTVSYRKSERVQILNEADIPTDYINIKETKSIDKTSIKQALKAGISVPGTKLEEYKNIQIK